MEQLQQGFSVQRWKAGTDNRMEDGYPGGWRSFPVDISER